MYAVERRVSWGVAPFVSKMLAKTLFRLEPSSVAEFVGKMLAKARWESLDLSPVEATHYIESYSPLPSMWGRVIVS